MNPDLHDDTGTRCSISLLWDADALIRFCPSESIRGLREFLRLRPPNWPEADPKLINWRMMIVAGLQAAMDPLTPKQAWRKGATP